MQVDNFIKNIKNWENYYRILKFKDCKGLKKEVSDIIEFEIKGDIDSILQILQNKSKKKYFEINHPFLNIKSRGVCSFFACNVNNFIFMNDMDNKFPWMFVQDSEFCGMIIVNNYILYSPYKNLRHVYNCMNYLKENIDNFKNKLIFRNIEYIFSLKSHRPFHFFFDQLSNFLNINYDNVRLEPLFYMMKGFNYIEEDKDFIDIHPKTIGINAMIQLSRFDKLKDYFLNTISMVYNDALSDYDKIVICDNDYDLKLWIGLPGEKRSWIEQVDGICYIVEQLSLYFKKIKIYFDGMTSFENAKVSFMENNILFENISHKINLINLKKGKNEFCCDLISLIGLNYREKICYASQVDFVISEGSTTGLIPFVFARKPGVIIEIWNFREFYKEFCSNIEFVDVNKVEFEKQSEDLSLCDYHLSYVYVFELIIKLLKKEGKM
ncbi:hypothetical protein E2O24_04575 [Campylobacter volucris]|uniref:hypothetical protein n=1 Tax=Campylobacter volucris TaxID=1031542 RepID=UPI001059B4E6|nr:hypothetical protein [Campylobacter volucris]TDJ86651.1 hypothetical protein E2O24_04575 [Campylobacter volucris]